jgi:TetR/AcrR family transcriptional regulator, lmrAB and yxaGH operons repressor
MAESSVNRNQLIEQLTVVFERNGYAGATLSQLAAAVGLSKSSLYHHFPGGKREMAEALLRHAVAELEVRAFSKLQGPERPATRMAAFLEGFSDYVDGGRSHCLLAVLAQGGARDELGEQIAAQVRDWTRLVAKTLEQSGIKPKRARRLASDLFDQLYGSLTVSKMLNEPKHFERAIGRVAKRLRKVT